MLNSIEINPSAGEIDWTQFNLPQRNYQFFTLTHTAKAVENYILSIGGRPKFNEMTSQLQLQHFLSLQ